MLDDIYARVKPGPPRPSKIIEPTVFSMPPGVERYVVEGGGAILIRIEAGDRFTIINAEGGQPCEVVAADETGRIDPGMIGGAPNSDAAGLKGLLSGNDQSLRGLRMGLEARGLDLSKARAHRFWDGGTPAKAEENFAVERDGVLIVSAPGGAMDLEAQDTLTPLTVMVTRAVIKRHTKFELPDPLADPLQSIRVHSATAEAYFVKAGDYIQIQDVDGRQCTDFECFSASKLDKGIEHALDVTTTRTLMHHSYPMPGLHAKYYDQEMLPLVEVVQDTCGRHDAFAMACSEKYYNDIGYPRPN